MDKAVLEKVSLWRNNPYLDKSLKDQIDQMTEEQLIDAFTDDISFGTAGLRGEIGAGSNRMNVPVVKKTTLGFYNYLVKRFANALKMGVAIAYDPRRMSKEFSQEAAKVLATRGMKVYIFSSLRPTPELSFTVRELKCCAGIMVTASHNPPQYNGYKVYDDSGCQLIPDLADMVTKEINAVEDMFNIETKSFDELRKEGLIEVIDKEIDDKYISKVQSITVQNVQKDNIKVVYTPLHGTGSVFMVELLNKSGYSYVYPVKEQMVADSEFSTLKLPNPEDPGAFKMAIELGEKIDADILIATDPDADRMGIAAKNAEGKYQLLTGNQTGAILLNYLAEHKAHDKNSYVYNTIVTSNIAKAICEKKNLTLVQTLTGFKYIGEQAALLEGTNKSFFFGYEESYGCVVAPFVRDKDSFQATLLLCEVASYYKGLGKTLVNVLEDIYAEYGYYVEGVENIALVGDAGTKKIKRIMKTFQEMYFDSLAGKKIVTSEDYDKSLSVTNNQVSKITLPKSSVLRYIFEDGGWFALRPSGTEPKLKIYFAVKDDNKEKANNFISKLKEEVLSIVRGIE